MKNDCPAYSQANFDCFHLFELKLLRMRLIILICFGVVLEQWDFDSG